MTGLTENQTERLYVKTLIVFFQVKTEWAPVLSGWTCSRETSGQGARVRRSPRGSEEEEGGRRRWGR